MKRVITYGTFDTIHFGHILLLKRARSFGDHLTVGLSTDEFNASKGKTSYFKFAERKEMLEAISYVDQVIPEDNWEQKELDVTRHNIDVFTIGDDWRGEFDFLEPACSVVYLERTPSISSTLIKANMDARKRYPVRAAE